MALMTFLKNHGIAWKRNTLLRQPYAVPIGLSPLAPPHTFPARSMDTSASF